MAGHTFPVLPTQAYMQITGMYDIQGGAAISFVLLVPALIAYLLQRYWVEGRYYVTVSGKAGARSQAKRCRYFCRSYDVSRHLSHFFVHHFLVFHNILGIPGQGLGVDNSFTLENYKYVFTVGWKAVKDTVLIAIVSTIIGSVLGVAIGYLVNRKELPGGKALEFVSYLITCCPERS